jgi:hypothetical protein
LEPEKSILIHDVTLFVHPRRHINRVQFSFYETTLPPPSLPAGASLTVTSLLGASSSIPSSASGSLALSCLV